MSVRQENRLASVYATVWKDDNATLTTAMIVASAIRAALFRHLAMGRAVVRSCAPAPGTASAGQPSSGSVRSDLDSSIMLHGVNSAIVRPTISASALTAVRMEATSSNRMRPLATPSNAPAASDGSERAGSHRARGREHRRRNGRRSCLHRWNAPIRGPLPANRPDPRGSGGQDHAFRRSRFQTASFRLARHRGFSSGRSCAARHRQSRMPPRPSASPAHGHGRLSSAPAHDVGMGVDP